MHLFNFSIYVCTFTKISLKQELIRIPFDESSIRSKVEWSKLVNSEASLQRCS